MEAFGGEARAVTDVARGVAGFGWRDDGTLLFTAQEEPTRREKKSRPPRKPALRSTEAMLVRLGTCAAPVRHASCPP